MSIIKMKTGCVCSWEGSFLDSIRTNHITCGTSPRLQLDTRGIIEASKFIVVQSMFFFCFVSLRSFEKIIDMTQVTYLVQVLGRGMFNIGVERGNPGQTILCMNYKVIMLLSTARKELKRIIVDLMICQ